jgi:hypothetical protein
MGFFRALSASRRRWAERAAVPDDRPTVPNVSLCRTTKQRRRVIEVAVRGDEAPATLAERSDWRAIVRAPSEEVFARFAALNAALMARTAPIIALAEAAAETELELAAGRRGHRP